MSTTPRLFRFGYCEEVTIKCEKLDAFLNDLLTLIARHGIGLCIDQYREYPKMQFCDAETAQNELVDLAGRDLSEHYAGGVDWFDQHLEWWHACYNVWSTRGEMIKATDEENRKLEKIRRRRDKLMQSGLTVDGKRYRLVEE